MRGARCGKIEKLGMARESWAQPVSNSLGNGEDGMCISFSFFDGTSSMFDIAELPPYWCLRLTNRQTMHAMRLNKWSVRSFNISGV